MSQTEARKQRKKRMLEAAASLLVGVGLAEFCKVVPEAWRLPCSLLRTVLSLLIGG